MTNRRRKTRRTRRGGGIALRVILTLALALTLAFGAAALNANMVRVRRAEVCLRDLPAAFDGRTILYAADIDLCGLNTAQKSGALFQKLQSLRPDMLILGGDYASASLLEVLNRPEQGGRQAQQTKSRSDFFRYIISPWRISTRRWASSAWQPRRTPTSPHWRK